MAFNIWERWPWTSFQNLNLDWLMKAVKEAVTKAEEASESVGQFDTRITANENAIEQLGIDLETISSPAHVLVNSELEARYRGNLVTGAQLVAMMRTHGDLPYVEFNGEVYMLDTASNAGDLRFSMGHTSGPMDDDLVIRHIMIPAQSSNCAYSISNIGSGGGSSGNVFAVVVRAQSGGYVSDHTYAEILSQMQNGRVPVLLVVQGTQYESCPMARVGTTTSGGQTVNYIEFADTSWMVSNSNVIGSWRINSDGTVDRMAPFKHLATVDNIIQMVNDGVTTNALLKTAQTLSAAEQAQVKQNLGISGGGSYSPYLIPVALDNGVYSTTATGEDVFDHILDCRIVFNGVHYYQIGSTVSGPVGNAYFACSDPSTSGKIENDIFAVRLNGTAVCTVTRYEKDVELLFAPPIVDTATGDPASITDGANHYPLKSLIANIDPVQSGSGDPSPTNVRPITGWTEIRITKAITGDSGYWDITLPSAAGIVYGGTLDAVAGVLTVDKAIVDLSALNWAYYSTQSRFVADIANAKRSGSGSGLPGMCSIFAVSNTSYNYMEDMTIVIGSNFLGDNKAAMVVRDSSYTDADAFKTSVSGQTLVYPIANPTTYQIDPIALYTALGHNGFSADSGAVTVEYYADTKLYIQKMISTGNRTTGTALASSIKETKDLEETRDLEETKEPEDEESDDN